MTSNTDKMDKAWLQYWSAPKPYGVNVIHQCSNAFKAGYQAREAESGWVLFKDIPDEWKDGRCVCIFSADAEYDTVGILWLEGQGWHDFDAAEDYKPCLDDNLYAILPPTPPKENN
ncbi:MAG: hypothetical protein COA43_11105 [Robiginitomaculum sp.]|nr:MAG: hypothetical protein COA43_11105 [Robiginitomaculum sp.]